MRHRRNSVSMPRWMILVLGAALVLAYVPLTGLDHLHLHLEHGLRFAHDHLHVGHHDHSHAEPAEPAPDGRGEHRDGDDDSAGSAVVSFGNASQVRPLAIDLDHQDSLLPRTRARGTSPSVPVPPSGHPGSLALPPVDVPTPSRTARTAPAPAISDRLTTWSGVPFVGRWSSTESDSLI